MSADAIALRTLLVHAVGFLADPEEARAVVKAWDSSQAECERLAGRVAALMDTLEIIETSPTVEDANRVARSARSEVFRAADVGGSE